MDTNQVKVHYLKSIDKSNLKTKIGMQVCAKNILKLIYLGNILDNKLFYTYDNYKL
jgi:hypothetical protein